MNIRKALPGDYPEIIEIQNANRPEQLSESERKQGFLASSMNEQQLAEMNTALGILVAIDKDQVAGFVCMAPTSPLPGHPVIKAMYGTFAEQRFHGKPLTKQRVFFYGPVCIDQQWRGQGLLKKLFSAVKDFTRKDYDIGAAFIDQRNPHSLAAHVNGLNMTALTPFDCEERGYDLVVFSTQEA